ncbi:uncharacterized protein LOC113851067 [Abrus precatorius]|uniref:Uncharacterized protein LOC113851067 n=1 Tax=Abrus precatorius TaxID=3816 RepID=A0A8B8K0X1_ABRPR|nr:uncharacterized protein LOC113851067 [Abrus precatorius]
MSKKLKDPGSFTLPCLIGRLIVDRALADLGASINLMPYYVFKKLGLGESRPTRMSIQLADRPIKYPRGIIEDVLVKVDKFIFHVDFVILDMDEDTEVSLILGHPFLATAKAIIDVSDGKLILRVGDEKVTFKISEVMKKSLKQDDSCFFLNVIDDFVSDCAQEFLMSDPLERSLVYEEGTYDMELLTQEQLCHLEATKPLLRKRNFEVLEQNLEKQPSPSTDKSPDVKLKVLPEHLKYAFLEDGCKLPVIIASKLTQEQKGQQLNVVREHKKAIAWKISDIRGINLSFCTHKILMESDIKAIVQP